MVGTKSTILILVVAFIAYKYFNQKPVELSAIVTTEYGELQGIQSVSRNGRKYSEYLQIPYAKPPVGELRFEAPLPPEKWTGVRAADKYGHECSHAQIVFGNHLVGSEDCLFLNVFTPARTKSTKKLLPVMVFIHGGHYMEGSANLFRPDFFMDEESVILVTLNYRLGALGFLSTADGVIRGNFGLKDQNMALQYIQRNIEHFGGDPKQVTLFGESAGAASTHLHVVSPKSKGLIQRAISQSGNAWSYWTIQTSPKEQADRFAGQVGCPTDNTREMLKCLKKLPVDEILKTHVGGSNLLKDPLSMYLPTVEFVKEGAFLPEHPRALIKSMKSAVPWMTGVNNDEARIVTAFIERNETAQEFFGAHPENLLHGIPRILFAQELTVEETKKLRKYYFGVEDEKIDFKEHFDNCTNLISDVFFNYQFQQAVQFQSQHSPVYAYYYDYHGEFSFYNLVMALKGDYSVIVELLAFMTKNWINKNILGTESAYQGACHADDLALLFKLQMLSDITTKDKDYEMSKKLIKLWTSFAANEEPLKYNDVIWKPFNPKAPNFEVFNINLKGKYITVPFGDRTKFLKNNIKNI